MSEKTVADQLRDEAAAEAQATGRSNRVMLDAANALDNLQRQVVYLILKQAALESALGRKRAQVALLRAKLTEAGVAMPAELGEEEPR